MTQVRMDEATVEQLRHYATVHKGLAIGARASAPEIIALLRSVQDGDMIDVTDQAVASTRATRGMRGTKTEDGASTTSNGKPEKQWYVINIARQPGVGGNRDIPISINGVIMTLPRGKPIEVAAKYVEVLNNAIQDVYEQNAEGGLERREALRYPFQIVKGPYTK